MLHAVLRWNKPLLHYSGTFYKENSTSILTLQQGISQDLETGCLKLAIVKLLGVQIFKGEHNILTFQP